MWFRKKKKIIGLVLCSNNLMNPKINYLILYKMFQNHLEEWLKKLQLMNDNIYWRFKFFIMIH